jgi:diphthine-ammonia ligase
LLGCVTNLQVAALVTGGKDSALALYRALNQGFNVKYLVTMMPRRPDSWMFHYPNIHVAEFFAEAVGIPLVKGETSGVKETELKDLKRVLAGLQVDGVVAGAITSQYQKKRVDRICQELNLKSFAPLWHEKPRKLLAEMVDLGFEVLIVGVYAYGFDATWLGRKIDQQTINDLIKLNNKYQISVVGEGGEYETLVLDAPFFKRRIQLVQTEKTWDNHSGCLIVKRAKLAEK